MAWKYQKWDFPIFASVHPHLWILLDYHTEARGKLWLQLHTDTPENAVASVGTRGEATEAKSLFALNVSQHKCEVLADLVDCQAAWRWRGGGERRGMKGGKPQIIIIHSPTGYHAVSCVL